MTSEDKSVGMLQDYLGLDGKTMITFTGLVVSVLVVVTGIYVSIFGFDTWKTNMKRAGSLMVINAQQPVNGAQPGMNNGMALPAAARMPAPATPYAVPLAPPAATQFVCPACGASGLPAWTTNGAPVCPSCGAVMGATGGQATAPGTTLGL